MICKQCKTNPVSRRGEESTKTGLCGQCLQRPFPITSVCRLDLIGIPPHWQPRQIDTKLTAFLRRHSPAYFKGRVRTLGAAEEKKAA